MTTMRQPTLHYMASVHDAIAQLRVALSIAEHDIQAPQWAVDCYHDALAAFNALRDTTLRTAEAGHRIAICALVIARAKILADLDGEAGNLFRNVASSLDYAMGGFLDEQRAQR